MKQFLICFTIFNLLMSQAFPQGIQLSTNFTVNTNLPIDDRMTVATIVERDALATLRRYEGLIVFVASNEESLPMHYALMGGIDNANWTPIGGGGKGGIAEWMPSTKYKEKDVVFNGTKIYYSNAEFTSGATFDPIDWTELSPLDLSQATGQLPQINGSNFLSITQSGTDSVPVDTNMLKVPHSQLTSTGGKTRRIETGNNNLLLDPGFEGIGAQWGGLGIRTTNASEVFEGDKGFTWPLVGAGLTIATQTVSVEKFRGLQLETHFYSKVDKVISFCLKDVTNAKENCVDVQPSTTWKKTSSFPQIKTNATTYEFTIKTKDAGSEGAIDSAYFGLPLDNLAFANLKASERMESCGLLASDVTGFGTITNINIDCSREGGSLIMMGSFTVGTSTSAEITMNVKYKGQQLRALKSFKNLGNAVRSANDNIQYPRDLNVFIKDGTSNEKMCMSFTTGSSSTLDPLSCQTGTNVALSGQTINLNLRIPIAEWQDSINSAVLACREGDRVCSPSFSASILNTGVVSSEGGIDWINGNCVLSGNNKTCTLNNLKISNPMICTATGIGAGGMIVTTISSSTSQVVFATDPNNYPINIHCTKHKDDQWNPSSAIVGWLNWNDISPNEIDTGGTDHFTGKKIYQRCHKVVSDVTSNTTLTTWTSGLIPIGIPNYFTALWRIVSPISGASMAAVDYNSANGQLSVSYQGSGVKVGIGTVICMKYVKP